MREPQTRIAIAARAAALLMLSLGPVDHALAHSATSSSPRPTAAAEQSPPPQSVAPQSVGPQSAVPQTPPPPPAPPVVSDDGTVKLELRIFDGPEDVTSETRVRLYPRGQRTNDLPTATAAGQAITAAVPVGFYDAQAIRDRRGEVAGLRWAEQLLVQRYPDEYGRHLEMINFRPGFGGLQIRPAPDSAPAAKGWTGIAYPSGETAKEAGKGVVAGEDLLFGLPAGSYDIKLTMGDKTTQWMRDIEVPADRTRLKTWATGSSR
jgi:hypothetical protein